MRACQGGVAREDCAANESFIALPPTIALLANAPTAAPQARSAVQPAPPRAPRRPQISRSSPRRPCARQPAAKRGQSQPRSGGEKPRARRLRSVPARLCGIRGGRAAPHMHPQAPRGVAAAARAKRNTHQPKRPCPASAMLSYGRRCSAATNRRRRRRPPRGSVPRSAPAGLAPGGRGLSLAPAPIAAQRARQPFAAWWRPLQAGACARPAAPTWPRRSCEMPYGAGPRRWKDAAGPPRSGAPALGGGAPLWQAPAHFVASPGLMRRSTRSNSTFPSYYLPTRVI